MSQTKTTRQKVYDLMLKDDRVRCTCDETVREESFFQAAGHYHHCMLFQVTRAIELTERELQAQLTDGKGAVKLLEHDNSIANGE